MAANPVQAWNKWFELSAQAFRLGWEAQTVMTLRMMRIAEGGAQGATEAQRMVTEKLAAVVDAQAASAVAALAGGDSHRVSKKVMGVYGKRVRGNKRRLTR